MQEGSIFWVYFPHFHPFIHPLIHSFDLFFCWLNRVWVSFVRAAKKVIVLSSLLYVIQCARWMLCMYPIVPCLFIANAVIIFIYFLFENRDDISNCIRNIPKNGTNRFIRMDRMKATKRFCQMLNDKRYSKTDMLSLLSTMSFRIWFAEIESLKTRPVTENSTRAAT